MATIAAGQQILTIINVLGVAPDDSQDLIDLLIRTTEEVTSRHAGYLSMSLHLSRDRTKVTSYAQWRSRDDFDAMLDDPEAQAGMAAVRRLASPAPAHYDVVWVHPPG
ncbi:MAG TPA: antibiotic biosynthesis monooxygenase family protein [Acidimicrobiales bacterium]|jgi:heme-degrading monooxygenase HmoA|nr:antibiotic biosynthesis monooxygenase family protein [Acidimicrobiales bacterium]